MESVFDLDNQQIESDPTENDATDLRELEQDATSGRT